MASDLEAIVREGIRDITDDEIAFYHENGWVKLDGLVAPELAELLLHAGQELGVDATNRIAIDPGLEPFRSLVFSERMGRNAQRLFNRRRLAETDVPVRYRADHLTRRDPGSGKGTPYHQDSTEHGTNRVGEFNLWLALAEVTPEMGAVRYLNGVHREGPLGSGFHDADLLDIYPKLLDLYELSPPFHYQPGDATVHHGYMIHGAPPNTSDRARWGYIMAYTPADTGWFNGEVKNHGSKMLPPDGARYPIVYPAA